MRTAADLMTPNPKMVGSGESLQDVIKLFLDQGITSSPVINPVGEILGALTELGLVKAYMLHKLKLQKNDRVGHHIDLLDPISYVDIDTPVSETLRAMLASSTHRLLVKSGKKIVGIISPKDLMRGMLGEANPMQNLREKLKETETQLRESLSTVKNLKENLKVYQRVFHETPYMMHAVDRNGKILMANKREHDALGYNNGELVGKTIFDIYSPAMHKEAQQGLEKIIETGRQNITYTSMIKKDGSTIRCDIISSAIVDSQGKFVSTISALRPIDAEELLRSLHGILSESEGPLSRYANK